MHVHASAFDALVVIAYMLIALFILRAIAVKYPESTLAQGLAFIVT